MLRKRFGCCCLFTGVAALGFAAAQASACDKCHDKCAPKCEKVSCCEKVKCEKPVKGDLKCMNAKINCPKCGDFTVNASYYVNVRHARCEDFDVVLIPMVNDQELEGKVTVPVSATGWCHREGATLAIPNNVDPKCLHIRGQLVLRSTGEVLDDETSKVHGAACCKVKTCEVRTACATPCDPCGTYTTSYAEPVYESRTVSYSEPVYETRPAINEIRYEHRRPCNCH